MSASAPGSPFASWPPWRASRAITRRSRAACRSARRTTSVSGCTSSRRTSSFSRRSSSSPMSGASASDGLTSAHSGRRSRRAGVLERLELGLDHGGRSGVGAGLLALAWRGRRPTRAPRGGRPAHRRRSRAGAAGCPAGGRAPAPWPPPSRGRPAREPARPRWMAAATPGAAAAGSIEVVGGEAVGRAGLGQGRAGGGDGRLGPLGQLGAELLDLVGRAAEVAQRGVVLLDLRLERLGVVDVDLGTDQLDPGEGRGPVLVGRRLDRAAHVRVDGRVDAPQVEGEVARRAGPLEGGALDGRRAGRCGCGAGRASRRRPPPAISEAERDQERGADRAGQRRWRRRARHRPRPGSAPTRPLARRPPGLGGRPPSRR